MANDGIKSGIHIVGEPLEFRTTISRSTDSMAAADLNKALHIEVRNKNPVLAAIQSTKQTTLSEVCPPKPTDSISKLSSQLLEIPHSMAKSKRPVNLVPNTDIYNNFQHKKFATDSTSRKLSIVEGPQPKERASWGYNHFLYLNAK